MTCSHPGNRSASSVSNSSTIKNNIKWQASVVGLALFAAIACLAQDQASSDQKSNPQPNQPPQEMVTIPAGTKMALVLTQPIESRYIHRGDDIYAQVTAPVNARNEVVIPPGTFVQGTVEKLGRRNGRGEVRLQSMSITFPDGYVSPIPGPITLQTDEGYAIKDPGPGRVAGAIALPAGGAGLGALIGHSVGGSSSTITSTVPPGCTGQPPGCISSSVTAPGNAGRNTVIGAGVGGAIGGIASIILLVSSHHFFIEAGAPIEMRLEEPVSLPQGEVVAAVRQSAEHPMPPQPVLPRPTPPPPTDVSTDHGTCFTPGTPGTPDTVIPGAPGPDGIPGPPTIIPGTPATPGTPYPCP